jgi:hypothetical protein
VLVGLLGREGVKGSRKSCRGMEVLHRSLCSISWRLYLRCHSMVDPARVVLRMPVIRPCEVAGRISGEPLVSCELTTLAMTYVALLLLEGLMR